VVKVARSIRGAQGLGVDEGGEFDTFYAHKNTFSVTAGGLKPEQGG